MVGNDSNKCDCNIFPATGSSESIPVGSPMDDILVGFKSQPKTFTRECGGTGENTDF